VVARSNAPSRELPDHSNAERRRPPLVTKPLASGCQSQI
jgi:hypothetical protein